MNDERIPLLIGVKEAAKLLGIGVSTVYELQKSKLIPKPIKLKSKTVYRYDELAMWVRLRCPTQATFTKELNRERRRRWRELRETIGDTYVKRLLTDNTCLSAKDIPQIMVEAKREHIKLQRMIKELVE